MQHPRDFGPSACRTRMSPTQRSRYLYVRPVVCRAFTPTRREVHSCLRARTVARRPRMTPARRERVGSSPATCHALKRYPTPAPDLRSRDNTDSTTSPCHGAIRNHHVCRLIPSPIDPKQINPRQIQHRVNRLQTHQPPGASTPTTSTTGHIGLTARYVWRECSVLARPTAPHRGTARAPASARRPARARSTPPAGAVQPCPRTTLRCDLPVPP